MLELYHAGLSQASVKVRTTLAEKGLAYQSHFLRLPEGEHLTPEFLALNPDGQVPALVHDGEVITETTVINEYLEDAFPDPPLRPASPIERARMRRWSQIVDEHLFHAIATIGWAFGIGPILRERGLAEFEKSLARITLHSKRQKWFKAYHGFPQEDLDEARAKIASGVARMEQALAEHRYLAGPSYSLADINVLSSVERMPRWSPDLMNQKISPRTFEWLQRLMERPAVKATYSVSAEAPPRSTELRAARQP
ncbi:MAG TPA: glutathione S-transferase family protein [Xanthobacteraceae bacterium]|jgi:glutathione S-transferase